MMNDDRPNNFHGFSDNQVKELLGDQILIINRQRLNIENLEQMVNRLLREADDLRKAKENG